MRRLRRLAATLAGTCLALAAGRPAAAQETVDESPGARAIGFSSASGITGMRNMIDGRVPERENLRASLRYSYTASELESARKTRTDETHSTALVLGGSALGLLDGGARLPFLQERTVDDRAAGRPPRERDGEGPGPLTLAGKVSFFTPPFALAPYVIGRVKTARSRVVDSSNQLETGLAATATTLGQELCFHGNLAFVDRNAGRVGLAWRLGASVLPWASEDVTLRVYFYVEGLTRGDAQRSILRATGGTQWRLFGSLSLSLGAEAVVYDDTLKRGARDEATWSIRAGPGVSYTF